MTPDLARRAAPTLPLLGWTSSTSTTGPCAAAKHNHPTPMMIPRLFAFSLLTLAGCSSVPYAVDRPESDRYASLSMVSSADAQPLGNYNGIKSVDAHKFSSEVGSTVFVLEGRRVIGYYCPGWISTDGGPTLTYDFKAGATYVLDCNGTPSIRLSADPS